MAEIDGVKRIAVACTCSSVPSFAKKWLEMAGEDSVSVLYGSKLKTFVSGLPESQIRMRLEEILHKRGRFAYFFSYMRDTGQVEEEIDILHGGRRK